jgi:hypothetical protein
VGGLLLLEAAVLPEVNEPIRINDLEMVNQTGIEPVTS